MARFSRLFLPNIPLHIVQRGHDRQPVFVQPPDYQLYLTNLKEAKKTLAIRVFAYCLMTNHVHMIVAPGEDVTTISTLMKTLAARQTRYVNTLEGRSGTLWEGRFKASLIDSEEYLLACCRYVELNPVRAAMVDAPDAYRWSSYRARVVPNLCGWLDGHTVFRQLGENRRERARAYTAFVTNGIHPEELERIRTAVQRNQLTGNERFRKEIEARTGRRVSVRGRGRPRKAKKQASE